jgi:hypothetical protein
VVRVITTGNSLQFLAARRQQGSPCNGSQSTRPLRLAEHLLPQEIADIVECFPGAGKSRAFPVSGFGVDFFNADDRAAALNHGSYLNITPAIRDEVNILFESFQQDHIERRASCAFETTLRSGITCDRRRSQGTSDS